MKLLINARYLTQNISGVQRFGMELSLQLKKNFPDISFLCPRDIKHISVAEELEAETFGNFSGHIWEQFELPLYIRKKYPDSLLINFCNTAPLFVSKQFVTIHDVSYFVNPNWFSLTFRLWYRWLIPKIARNAVGIFTVSNFSKSEILHYITINPDKITVVNNSVSGIFKHLSIQVSKQNYILSVSSIDPRKNLKTLIEAFDIVANKYPGLQLILVGASHKAFSKDERLLTMVNSSNKKLTGYITDEELSELYRNARCFLYLSLYEGFGIPPLEAMSSGCPVLLSDIECHREIFKDSVAYCDPLNVNDITERLIGVLSSEYEQNKLEEMVDFSSKYSWAASSEIIKHTIIQYLQ